VVDVGAPREPAVAPRLNAMPVDWTPDDLAPRASRAFRHARRRFLRGDRIDMLTIAAELDVNRVTLYRWIGRREELLVRILWSLGRLTLRELTEEISARGWDRARVPEVLSRYVLGVLSTHGMRTFLRTEGDLAMRLLTTSEWGFQSALLHHVNAMLRDDIAAGVRDDDEPLADLAFAAVRIMESFVYSDRITGEEPDAERARRVLHVLLR
jgi:AcrR family transcriptional regulator